VLSDLEGGNTTVFSYLAEEVFARHPDAVRGMVGTSSALFERFTPELCEGSGSPGSRSILADLSRQGLFRGAGTGLGRFALRPLDP